MTDDNSPQTNKSQPLDPALPILTAAVDPDGFAFTGGEGMWAAVKALAENEDVIEKMDLAMEGQSAPRVWLVLHEPGESEWAAVTAMAFAQKLSERDQVALVLDCDDRSLALTHWADRFECEGWIDLARYGISLLAAGMELPFDGRRGYFLGVGSFAPTDVTSEEIQTVMNRLRRQADDMILVAPADEIGKQWAAAANIKLLCWNQAGKTASELGGLVQSLAADGCQLTGLLGLGVAKPEPLVAEPPAAEPISEPTVPEAPELIVPEFEPEPDTGDESFNEASPQVESDTKTGTSGVFWFLATAAVVIVAIMGVYWFQYVREPAVPVKEPRQVAAQLPQTATSTAQESDQESTTPPEAGLSAGDRGSGGRLAGDPVAGEMANGDDIEPADNVGLGDTSAVVVDTAGAAIAPPLATEISDPTAAVQDAVVQDDTTPDASDSLFDMQPYRSAVGVGGWALHLYSLNTESGANVEVAELKRRGFATEVRIVEKADAGRLWRVYVGSFASRTEARAASESLKEKLKTDWANPTRF